MVRAVTKTRVNSNQDTNLFRSEIFHINGSLQDTKLVLIKQINKTLGAIKTNTNKNITDIKLHHEYVTLFTQVEEGEEWGFFYYSVKWGVDCSAYYIHI